MLLLISSCSTIDVYRYKEMPEIDEADVIVYYGNYPSCEYSLIAQMEVSGSYFSKSAILSAFKQKAAALGANGVVVDYLTQSTMKEYSGTAEAIRCKVKEISYQ